MEGTGLTARMRGILVDWLVQVHLRFHLLQETLYLTIAIIDRFLQVCNATLIPVFTLSGSCVAFLCGSFESAYRDSAVFL